jgi:hypothetical protein
MGDLKKYRIKTKAELIMEYGDSWRCKCNIRISYWYEEMDFMLGKYLYNLNVVLYANKNKVIYIKKYSYSNGTFIISGNMLKIQPNYNPKKLVYD